VGERGLCALGRGAQRDATVLGLTGRGGGNPFLVIQLLRTLHAAGHVLISDGVATVVGDELPTDFLAAVAQRLRGLSPEALRMLQAGSVLSRPFAIHSAAQLIGARAVDLLPAADEAVAAGLLVVQDDLLAFGHDLLREAIYNSTLGPARSAMHRVAAAVVQTAGGSAVESAEHLIRGGADRSSVEVLREAAVAVAGRAPATAANLIVWALEMLGADDEARIPLSADAVGLLASAGRLVEARKLGEAALQHGLDPTTEATLLLGLAEALKHAGQNRAAVDYSARGLAVPLAPDTVRAQLYAIQAHALLYDMDNVPGVDSAGAKAQRLGTLAGEHGAAAFGLAARSLAAQVEGRLDEAFEHARDAVEVADRVGGGARHRHPRIWLGLALASLDRFAEADEAYTVGRQEADELGTAWSQPLWHYYHATLLSLQGQLDDATAEAEAGLRIAEQLTAYQLSVPLLGLLTRVATIQGRQPLAREHLRGMQKLLDEGVTAAPEDIAWTRAVFYDADNNAPEALSALAEMVDRFPYRLLLLANDPTAASVLVRIAQQTGAVDAARSTVHAARHLAERNPSVVSLAGAAAHADGLLRGSLAELHTAVARFRDSPRPLALASAMEDAAMAEQARGSRSRAVSLFEEAHDMYRNHGAFRGCARLERRLQRLGAGGQRSTRSAPSSSLAGLTKAELAVAMLVAQGATNRQVAEDLFISPHTVDSHLRHVFGKLGINKRVELARLVAKAEDEPGA
jgi:DNA-binding CsgD family transcriptional regulator